MQINLDETSSYALSGEPVGYVLVSTSKNAYDGLFSINCCFSGCRRGCRGRGHGIVNGPLECLTRDLSCCSLGKQTLEVFPEIGQFSPVSALFNRLSLGLITSHQLSRKLDYQLRSGKQLQSGKYRKEEPHGIIIRH